MNTEKLKTAIALVMILEFVWTVLSMVEITLTRQASFWNAEPIMGKYYIAVLAVNTFLFILYFKPSIFLVTKDT